MERIDAWRTTDGTVYDSEAEARKAQDLLDLEDEYRKRPLYADGFEDVFRWIRNNSELVELMLQYWRQEEQ